MVNNATMKVAIVTGGASGMGLAVARSLSAQGWKVTIADLNEKDGKAVAEEIGGIFVKTNVTIYNELATAFSTTWRAYGRLDFVFANAGVIERASFYAQQEKTGNGVPPPPNMLAARVMFDGPIMSVYLGIHFLRKNAVPGGSIVILASSAGIYPAPNSPLYTASKHSMVGLTRSMAGRLWDENIHLSCICPRSVATGLISAESFAKINQETFTLVKKIAIVVNILLRRELKTCRAAVEVVGQKQYLRWRPDYCDENIEVCWDGFSGSTVVRDGGLTKN